MPTYEYACPSGHNFELFQRMSDKPRARCPVCGKMAVRKISGGAGLVFKGSGFYITDYGKDGKGPRNDKSEKADKAASSESSAPKAEAPAKSEAKDKPAAKPDKSDKPAKKAKSE
jgi:putative FmdB family regulatory protein